MALTELALNDCRQDSIATQQQYTLEGLPERINPSYQAECENYFAMGRLHFQQGWSRKAHLKFAAKVLMPQWNMLYREGYRQASTQQGVA